MLLFFVFKQKTAYEMRISDWSSDVCSSDLQHSAIGMGDCRKQDDELEQAAPLLIEILDARGDDDVIACVHQTFIGKMLLTVEEMVKIASDDLGQRKLAPAPLLVVRQRLDDGRKGRRRDNIRISLRPRCHRVVKNRVRLAQEMGEELHAATFKLQRDGRGHEPLGLAFEETARLI